MSLISEYRVPAADFALGRMLSLEPGVQAVFQTATPADVDGIYLWLTVDSHDQSLPRLQSDGRVESVEVVLEGPKTVLCNLVWDRSEDPVFAATEAVEADVLRGEGIRSAWEFDVRFPSREAMVDFETAVLADGVGLSTQTLFTLTNPRSGPWFGVTDRQREALTLAVTGGYYDIPGRVTTRELADQLGISDQAVTERLRRAIATLVENALLWSEQSEP